MKKKIVGILVCMLLITTAALSVAGTMNAKTYKRESSQPPINPIISLSVDKDLLFTDSAETSDDRWDCHDDNPVGQDRFWGRCHNRSSDAIYSFYCAERYSQTGYIDDTPSIPHNYVNNMDAYMIVNDDNEFDLSSYDWGRFNYSFWVDTSSDLDDYFTHYWNSDDCFYITWTGSFDWSWCAVSISNTATKVGFIFKSDSAVTDEGVYADNIKVRGFDDMALGETYCIIPSENLYLDATQSTSEYDIMHYLWDFGDGEYAKGKQATHTYETIGLYQLTLTLIDIYNNINSTYAYVKVEENQPPTKPTITGQTTGKAGTSYTYTFTSTDPEGHQVSYYIDWDDGTTPTWSAFQPSGTPYSTSHTWSAQGTYNITAKAKDTYSVESDWGYLVVTMPKNKALNFNFNLLEWLFERFPNMFPILRHMLGL